MSGLFSLKTSARKRQEILWPILGGALSIVLLVAVWRYVEVSVHSLAASTPAAPPGAHFAELFEKNYAEGKKLFDEDDYVHAAVYLKDAVQQAEFFGEKDDRLRRSLEALRDTYARLNEIPAEQKIAGRLAAIQGRLGDEDFGDKDTNAAKIVTLSLALQKDKNDRKAVEELAKTLNDQSTLFYKEAQFGKAKEFAEQAQTLLNSTARGAHPLMGRTLSNLAYVNFELGDRGQAETLYKQALALREKSLGEHDRDTARSLRNLAEFYRLTGRGQQGEPLMRRALAVYRGLDGETSADIAWCLNVLGLMYVDKKEYDKALPLLQRAYKMRAKVLGAENVDTARSLGNLGRAHFARGENDLAEKEVVEASTILTKTSGPDHPETATAVSSLGELYEHKGDMAQAERQYKRAVNITSRLGGADAQRTRAYDQLISLYKKLGRTDEAQKLEARVQKAAVPLNQGSNR